MVFFVCVSRGFIVVVVSWFGVRLLLVLFRFVSVMVGSLMLFFFNWGERKWILLLLKVNFFIVSLKLLGILFDCFVGVGLEVLDLDFMLLSRVCRLIFWILVCFVNNWILFISILLIIRIFLLILLIFSLMVILFRFIVFVLLKFLGLVMFSLYNLVCFFVSWIFIFFRVIFVLIILVFMFWIIDLIILFRFFRLK